MPYNQEHMFFQWSGHFVTSGNEVMDDFVGGLRFVGPGLAAADNDDVLEAMARTFMNFWSGDGRNGIPGGALVDSFKWNRIGTDGRYVDSGNTRWFTPNAGARGTTSTRYPTQVACATTWTTDFVRGRASKGRTFWPTALPVNDDSRYRINTATQERMGAWARNLIVALNNTTETGTVVTVPDTGQQVPVVSSNLQAAVMSDIGTGRSSLITGIRVGDRLDIQRRRGNRVNEVYVATPI